MDTANGSSSNFNHTAVFVASAVFVIATTYILSKRRRNFEIPARDISKGHRWCFTGIVEEPTYCNVCELIVQSAGHCDSCGVIANEECMRSADKLLPCKSLSWSDTPFKHHWVKGNLSCQSICAQCSKECGIDDGFGGLRCCWCQKTIHATCNVQTDACDLGKYRDSIVPPKCVKLKVVGWKGRRHLVVAEVRPPTSDSWKPLIVLANRKSGNNDGERVLQAFRSILNPVQVIDLHDLPPEDALEWCRLVSTHICRILVSGGDGTVGWVLNAIDKLNIQPRPEVVIFPLGTGNDMSRVLGWGPGSDCDIDVSEILQNIQMAQAVALDRWKIIISPTLHLGIKMPSKVIYMNSYASIGVDAMVTLKFHQTRESKFNLFSNRLWNKFLFVSYATKDALERECKDLNLKLDVWIDDKKIELCTVEAVVVLNIPCWGAGVRPWQLGEGGRSAPQQRIDDGLVEVFAVYSIFHIAQMQMGLSEPVRLGQGKEVKFQLKGKVPMQVDGEPWEQNAAEIILKHHGQATMLSPQSADEDQDDTGGDYGDDDIYHY